MASEIKEDATPAEAAEKPKRSLLQKCWTGIKRCIYTILLIVLAYILILLVGLIPVNNDFEPTPDGIEILLVSNPVHSDIVLPLETETINWREHFPLECFGSDTSHATHVAIGWGDKGFFIETPTWDDLKFSTAANALLLPSDTCMHVSCTNADFLRKHARSVKISVKQYENLVAHINASFQHHDDGSKVQIKDGAYGQYDAFFMAHGNYHCLNTCNSWVGRAMKSGGMKTGWLTPMPKTMFLYLPEQDSNER